MKKSTADEWLVESALIFLRRAYPEMAATEPAAMGANQAREWWIARSAELKRK